MYAISSENLKGSENYRLTEVVLDNAAVAGKIQRIACNEISVIGRNTQGVRIMSLDAGDTLAAVKRVPRESNGNGKDAE